MSKEITYEIKEHICVISEDGRWNKELNVVSWNGGAPKWDIRSWSEDHSKMSRGITLTDTELHELVNGYEKWARSCIK